VGDKQTTTKLSTECSILWKAKNKQNDHGDYHQNGRSCGQRETKKKDYGIFHRNGQTS